MRDRKKRKQREEVRKILETMRLELAAQRMVQEQDRYHGSILRVDEIIKNARKMVEG